MSSFKFRELNVFLSTPSGWRATRRRLADRYVTCIISIHALRVEGDCSSVTAVSEMTEISIHALRVEGDVKLIYFFEHSLFISIHALRVEGDCLPIHH